MSKFQLINGELVQQHDAVLLSTNRSFLYGDGFFESMRVANGKLLQLNNHWARLEKTADFLQMSLPNGLNKRLFHESVLQLCSANEVSNAKVRFKAFRLGAGSYMPEQMTMGWSITCAKLPTAFFALNKKGLKVGIYRGQSVSLPPLSNYKTSNSLPYILGNLYAKKQGWDDCIMTDASGCIVEASSSNLFLVKESKLLTPDLSSGGLHGVMRQQILEIGAGIGLTCEETVLDEEDLLTADECFITSSIRGIHWIGAIDKKRYFHRVAERLVAELNRNNGLS